MDPTQVKSLLSQILQEQGLPGALAFLNGAVPLRYTAVHRYAGRLMKSVCFHDALGKRRPPFLSALPLDRSLAQFVKPGNSFRTNDSSKDPRLVGHAYEHVIFSYHGTALVSPSGQPWGVLCHFDLQAGSISDRAFEDLETVAPIVASFAIDPHQRFIEAGHPPAPTAGQVL